MSQNLGEPKPKTGREVAPDFNSRFGGNIVSASDQVIAWVTEMCYLGVYVTQSRAFKCSLEHAKRSFYRAANAIFAKVGRVASEEVTLHLFKSKCLPVLLYGLEVCPLDKTSLVT